MRLHVVVPGIHQKNILGCRQGVLMHPCMLSAPIYGTLHHARTPEQECGAGLQPHPSYQAPDTRYRYVRIPRERTLRSAPCILVCARTAGVLYRVPCTRRAMQSAPIRESCQVHQKNVPVVTPAVAPSNVNCHTEPPKRGQADFPM